VKTQRAYKVALDLNDRQRTATLRHAGAARWAYNWGLSTWKRLYEEKKAATPEGEKIGKVTDAMDLHRRLNAIKHVSVEDGGVPWMYEVSKCAPQEALRDLERAYRNTFQRLAEGKKGGFPRYKSKHTSRKSFRLTGAITVEGRRIRLPVIGWVRLAEQDYVPTDLPIKSVTVSEKAGRWFVSVLVEAEQTEAVASEGPIIGVDLGINSLATCSDGTVYENPKALNHEIGKIKRLSKRMARQQKTSNRRRKTKERLARAHARAANIRADTLHKMTTEIVKTKRPSVIVVEDLNVRGMIKNRRLAQSVSDAAFGEARRQFEYKARWNGVRLVVADRFYPSTKRCSCCGAVKTEMGLGERVFECESCGFTAGRDLNAAINLRDYPKFTTASSAVPLRGSARGGDVRPRSSRATGQTSSKREVGSKEVVA
jgi:putative transposase